MFSGYRRRRDSFPHCPLPRRAPRGSPRRAQRRAQSDQSEPAGRLRGGMQFGMIAGKFPLSVYPALTVVEDATPI